MKSQSLIDQLSTEVFFFNLMGKLLQTSPDKESLAWFQVLASENVFDDVLFGNTQDDIIAGAAKVHKWLTEELQADPSEKISALNIDYNQLLAGPGQPSAPPWESFYFNDQGLLFQEQTIQVREWFRRFNLESEKIFNEPDDHIGLEFSFLAHLAMRALAAVERDELAECEAVIQAQRDFLVEHPLKWVPVWCEKMLQHARTDFYSGVALLVKGGMKELAAIHKIEYGPAE